MKAYMMMSALATCSSNTLFVALHGLVVLFCLQGKATHHACLLSLVWRMHQWYVPFPFPFPSRTSAISSPF